VSDDALSDLAPALLNVHKEGLERVDIGAEPVALGHVVVAVELRLWEADSILHVRCERPDFLLDSVDNRPSDRCRRQADNDDYKMLSRAITTGNIAENIDAHELIMNDFLPLSNDEQSVSGQSGDDTGQTTTLLPESVRPEVRTVNVHAQCLKTADDRLRLCVLQFPHHTFRHRQTTQRRVGRKCRSANLTRLL